MKTRIPSVLIAFALVCFGLSPTAKALLPAPPPDGGYPGANTAEGDNALHDVNTAVGINNTAVGANALTHDTTGQYNVAVGSEALASNTTGNFNMAIGTEALTNNNANFNLAIGFRVLFMNTIGAHLTGIGAAALRNNTTASFNTAIGADALRENTTGEDNTAIGADALIKNTTGNNNTADGFQALYFNTTGNNNTAVGNSVLVNNTRGSNNIGVGFFAGQNHMAGDNNIYIGSGGFEEEGGTIRIGNANHTRTIIAGIRGVSLADGIPVYIDSAGELGTSPSSRAFKKKIKPMDKASESLLALKPVTFHYKSDTKDTPQFGLIAEEVAEVNPDLVVRDEKGDIYTVRYDAVNAMLLNEFLKEHRKNEEQQKQIDVLTVQLKEQAAQIQKVSVRLEASKPTPLVVNNP